MGISTGSAVTSWAASLLSSLKAGSQEARDRKEGELARELERSGQILQQAKARQQQAAQSGLPEAQRQVFDDMAAAAEKDFDVLLTQSREFYAPDSTSKKSKLHSVVVDHLKNLITAQ